MKKIVCLLLTLALSVSMVACGEIGGSKSEATSNSEVSTPVVDEVSFQEALFTAPDVNAHDGWWEYQWKCGPYAIGYMLTKEYNEGGDSNMYKSPFDYYVIATKAIWDDLGDDKALEVMDSSKFFEKFGREFTAETKQEPSNEMWNYNNYLDWINYFGFISETSDTEYDWRKSNSLVKTEKKGYPFADQELTAVTVPQEEAKLAALAENYIMAKFENTELTAPTSDWFNQYASLEASKEFLAQNGITADTVKVSIDKTEVRLTHQFPCVIVEYSVAPINEPDKAVAVRNVFAFEIVENSPSDFSYKIDSITDYSNENTDMAHGYELFEDCWVGSYYK